MPESSTVEILFWIVILLMLYTLTGYPVLLSFLASFKKEPQYPASNDRPMVSFIVAAYNEEKNIRAKLENLKQVEYDTDRLEFIIGSDASTDGTDEILSEAAGEDNRIKYFRLEKRGGKIAVLHRAMELAGGSIIVFTDCSVKTEPHMMAIILSCFADNRVGLVSSRDVWVDDTAGSPASQRQYIDYEMKIRRLESRLNSLVSASGSFFAVHRELFRAYGHEQADDFAVPLQVYRQGYKVIHRDDLVGYIPMVKSSEAEFKRRVRIVQAGIRTVWANRSLLNPFRYPLFAWQLWSHKVLKWLFPLMAIFSFVLAVSLWDDGLVYKIITLGYPAAFLIAVLALGLKIPKLSHLAEFSLISMGAILTAWYNIFLGSRAETWEPTHR